MLEIIPQLHILDTLYYADLAAYETLWPQICSQIETTLPGFTLSHAEIYTEGQERIRTGSMRHCLVPTERRTPNAI